jgi:hypothetical protein
LSVPVETERPRAAALTKASYTRGCNRGFQKFAP